MLVLKAVSLFCGLWKTGGRLNLLWVTAACDLVVGKIIKSNCLYEALQLRRLWNYPFSSTLDDVQRLGNVLWLLILHQLRQLYWWSLSWSLLLTR